MKQALWSFSFFILSPLSSPFDLEQMRAGARACSPPLSERSQKVITLDLEEYVMGVVAAEMPVIFIRKH